MLRTASWLDLRAFPSVLLAPFSLTKKRPPCAPAVAAIPDALFATLCDFVGIRAATFISADSLVPQGFHYDRLSRTGPLMTPAPPVDLHCSSKGKNSSRVCPSPIETVDKRGRAGCACRTALQNWSAEPALRSGTDLARAPRSEKIDSIHEPPVHPRTMKMPLARGGRCHSGCIF